VWYIKSTTPRLFGGRAVYTAALFFRAVTLQKRINVYIDGFNLYYGLVRGGSFKWLDLQKYFEFIRPIDDIVKIYYFTALINGKTKPNQDRYLAALNTLPKLEVILGLFKQGKEKCTDVNIAIQMLSDAFDNLCDVFILVSADNDLMPVCRMIRKRFSEKKLVVYIPARRSMRGERHSELLKNTVHDYGFMPEQYLKPAQFPNPVIAADGTEIRKPEDW
jgi:uncharacterized LabA/DUF88 family protein